MRHFVMPGLLHHMMIEGVPELNIVGFEVFLGTIFFVLVVRLADVIILVG